MDNLVPILTDGLIEVCRKTPDDPVDYLVLIYNDLIMSYIHRLNTYLEDLLMYPTLTLQVIELKHTNNHLYYII